MAINIFSILNFIGFIGFAVAFFYSLKLQKKLFQASELWLLMSIGSFFASLWALSFSIEWAGLFFDILDVVQNELGIAATVAFLAFTIMVKRTFAKPH